ncbi:hypothetical protein IWT140_02210 [Secundilactobacillus pentosiphilus]|uniref:Uncharacterized protein n=1 Tax=Secundilactobacillus pentosiphilus TaxID=1714682 RepID=A0A1Z5ISI6_9LACO|nr:hypothetical protein IWT140_02210 [Secundilactobacillus pentosiphilus]
MKTPEEALGFSLNTQDNNLINYHGQAGDIGDN